MSIRNGWRDEIKLSPSVNTESYCWDCNTFTYWNEHNTDRLICTKCGRRAFRMAQLDNTLTTSRSQLDSDIKVIQSLDLSFDHYCTALRAAIAKAEGGN